MLINTAIAEMIKNFFVKSKTIDFSDAPKVFLMATSLSFCSINNEESANKPSNATVKTMMFKIVKSVCCFWYFSKVLANFLFTNE